MPFRRAETIEDELHYYFQRETSAKYLDPDKLGRVKKSGWKLAMAGVAAGLLAGFAVIKTVRRGTD